MNTNKIPQEESLNIVSASQEELVKINESLFTHYMKSEYFIKKQKENILPDYKIHISINADLYKECLKKTKVFQILSQAVENGIINEFKLVNLNSPILQTIKIKIDQFNLQSSTLSAMSSTRGGLFASQLKSKESTEIFNNRRTLDNAVTIYLPAQFDYQKIAALCLELDNAIMMYFKNQSKPFFNVHARADLQLHNHLYFRKQTLNGVFANIHDEKDPRLERLRNEALQSNEFNGLKTEIEVLVRNPSKSFSIL